MSNCPYCNNSTLIAVTGTRARPDGHDVCQCAGCSGYSLRRDGKVFPLDDRTDIDGDPVKRIIDEVN